MVCLINSGIIHTMCISNYVIYGVVLVILGLMVASFMPSNSGKIVGVGLLILGLVLSVGFNIIAEFWNNNFMFRIIIGSVLVLIITMMILFLGTGKK